MKAWKNILTYVYLKWALSVICSIDFRVGREMTGRGGIRGVVANG
jgi:hypothetical protein